MGAQLLFDVMGAVGRQKTSDMPAPHRHLMIVLANYADDEGVAWPGKGTLAAVTGMSERTLFEVLPELESAGWLSRHRSGGGRASVAYYVRTEGGPVVVKRRRIRPEPADQPLNQVQDEAPPPMNLVHSSHAPGSVAPMNLVHSSHAPGADDLPIDPPSRTTQGPTQRAGAAGQPTLPLILCLGETPTPAKSKHGRQTGPKEPTSLQRYAAAYAAGIVDAAGGAFTPPTDSHAQHVFRTALPVHAKGVDGAPLRGGDLIAWIRRSAAEYRRARGDRAAFEAGFKPSNWKAWLESGKASSEARAPPAGGPRKGPVRQGLPDEMRADIAKMW